MGLEGDGTEGAEKRYEELILDLNMDKTSKDIAWQSFCRISQNYTLEGDCVQWLACALYVACRKTTVPTVGMGVMEGNGVSLTRLLRSAKLSLIEFFKKMKKWLDMANLPQEFRDKVDRLERNFAVSTVIFKKFEPIFIDVFRDPKKDPPRPPRGRKQKRLPCTPTDVFNYCWTTFVQVKGNFGAIGDDLVNSYHLLLCCIDWFYSNALLSNRHDLLNPSFSGLPENFTKEGRAPTEVQCIIQLLCEKHEGLLLEAKGIKEHWFKPYIKKLFDKKTLKGKAENVSGILEIGNYEANSKAVNQLYEEYVLSYGDFDERIFLLAEAEAEIGTPAKSGEGVRELSQQVRAVRNLQQHFNETTSLAPSTPLTGRRYLKQKDEQITPVSTATQSVSRLQTMLSGRKTSPSDNLLSIFKSCSRNPANEIQQRVKEMGEMFCTKYAQPSEDHMGSHIDFARRRLQLGECLYFKALENILENEKQRVEHRENIPSKTDFSNLLEQDIFHRSLFACCLEIVIFSYNAQRVFPWIVDVFGLSSYHFYKVIEVLIRAEESLSREVVKHLNHIEEMILDNLVWKTSSPLWDAIKNHKVPSVEEVSLPNQIEHESGTVVSASSISGIKTSVIVNSPLPHPAVRRVVSTERGNSPNPKAGKVDILQSPTGGAIDIYNSPAPGNAKRKLFSAGATPGEATSVTTVISGEEGTRSLTFFKTEDGKQVLVPVKVKHGATQPTAASLLTPINSKNKDDKMSEESNRPHKPKMSSLHLFFRKIYHLASVRLRDLCERLDVDSKLRSQMWTCFEHVMMEKCSLLMDRHLDQIIMCCVYVMAKVTQNDRSFQDIMRCYRLQPQAQSHVYRSVLLVNRQRHSSGDSNKGTKNASASSSPVNIPNENKEDKKKEALIRSSSTLPGATPGSHPPTPTQLIGNSNAPFDFDENPENRGDLIKFYNKVFVNTTKGFALKFSSHNQEKSTDVPLLSPLPAVRSHPSSPRRRVSTKHSVYVSPHKCHTPTLTPQSKLLYCFSRSPAKDLQAINNMLTMKEIAAPKSAQKRLLVENCDAAEAKKLCLGTSPVINTRLEEVVAQRANGTAR